MHLSSPSQQLGLDYLHSHLTANQLSVKSNNKIAKKFFVQPPLETTMLKD